MNYFFGRRACCSQKGFTLIELLVVVLIIGILAAVAVPQYFKIVEKGRFAEASNCFSTIKGAMERYNLKMGGYGAATVGTLDVICPASMKFFNAASIAPSASNYTVTLVRGALANTSYGAYTTTLHMPVGTFSCTSATNDCNDLLP